MPKKLPRWDKGKRITHDDLNSLSIAIENSYGFEVDFTTLNYYDSGSIRCLSAVRQRVAAYAKVTMEITAGNSSGSVLGKGKVIIQAKDDTGALSNASDTAEDCYNTTAVKVTVGQYIQVKWIDDDWAVDVVRCP